MEYDSVAGGEIAFESAPGWLQFSLSGAGNVANDDVNWGTRTLTATPELSIADVSQDEGDTGTTNFDFTVTLSHASNQTVTVAYATQDGTATVADNDYQAVSGTLTFDPGQTQKTISVPVTGDLKVEDHETFSVLLSSPTNATILDGTGTGTIENDDCGGDFDQRSERGGRRAVGVQRDDQQSGGRGGDGGPGRRQTGRRRRRTTTTRRWRRRT